ncbi:MAG: zinc-domain-containing protein [Nitrososphaeraceae archaeon]|nr:zinc-domain-containing protein [Nitrososphaeraceae archaeon]
MLEAKCHKCNNKALVDDEMRIVSCQNCHSEISYDEYLEIMKNKAINMGFDFNNDLNKNPF